MGSTPSSASSASTQSPQFPQLPTQSQLTTPLKSPIYNFDENQFSTYDILNSKHYNELENRRLFHQFVDAYEDFYDKRAEKNRVDIDLSKRLNISILIIVGSSIDCIQSRFTDGIYQKNAEDLSTALLLRHLFHNSYGIPFNQILITSTQESDFYVKDTETELISQPNTIFKGVNDSFLEKTEFHFTNKNETEFMLHQKINIAQVGDQQYKFFMKESLASVIMPFNINIIKKELTTNENSDLLVFFLRPSVCWLFL